MQQAPCAASLARSARRVGLPRRVGAVVTVLTAVCLGAAACGSGSSTGSSPPPAAGQGGSSTSVQAAALAYAQCMRAHGDSGFPDPSSQGGYGNSQNGGANPIDTTSPQYLAAYKSCGRLAPAGPTQAQNEQRTAQTLKYAACMRSHGIADFPDNMQITGQGDLNPSDPAFQAAAQACQTEMPGRAG